MKSAFLSRFTPSLMPPEALEAIFVRREREVERTVALIRESVLTAGKSHALFVGPRGIGKTHLVSLVYHRLQAMEDLRDRVRVAWLREEEWGVSSFLDVLQRILRALAEADPALEPRLAAVQAAQTEAAAEQTARDLLREIVGERTLLLLAENLDDLFDGIGVEGQKRFRAFLQDTRFTTILATSQSLFSGVSRQTAPFYNFFRTQHLSGLTLEDVILLLTKIAELEEDAPLVAFLHTSAGRARVRAVHHLAGGSPRVYVIFSEFLTREALDDLVAPFLKMLDELTPYYQSKMRSLSPLQRKIVEILSDARGALPVKEIAARSYSSHQTISSQLKVLRERGYVRAQAIGRDSLYELQEPLMRLCLEVKKQRGEPIKLFVDFLRLWCTREDLERRLTFLPPNAWLTETHLREALRRSETEEDPRVVACLKDYESFASQDDHEKALQVNEELIAIRGSASDWASKGWQLDQLRRHIEALDAYNQASVVDPTDADVLRFKSYVLIRLERNDEALTALNQSLTLNPGNAVTWASKGLVFGIQEHYGEALAAFEQSLVLDMSKATVWEFKGRALYDLDRNEEALVAMEQSLTLDPNKAEAWNNKGKILGMLGDEEQALASLDRAVLLDKNNPVYRLDRAETLIYLGRWFEVFEVIAELLPQFQDKPNELFVFTLAAVSQLLVGDQAQWQARAETLTALYLGHGSGLMLGQALVSTLPIVLSPQISSAARSLWHERWEAAAAGNMEFRFPLRLMDTAIRYRDSGDPPDPRILLELPQEERSIVESLLDGVDADE